MRSAECGIEGCFVGTRRAVSEMNKTEGHKNIKAATEILRVDILDRMNIRAAAWQL